MMVDVDQLGVYVVSTGSFADLGGFTCRGLHSSTERFTSATRDREELSF